MLTHRLKRNFTGGELAPTLLGQVENDRYKYGCKQLRNMIIRPQGPTSRREGFRFVYDLTDLIGTYDRTVKPRMVNFEYDKGNSYALIFFYNVTGGVKNTRVVFAMDNGLVEDPLSPGDPYIFQFTGTLSIEDMVYKQSADILFIVQPNRTPIEFKRLGHADWAANEAVILNPPADWNGTDGYPQFVDFFEQRLAYAATAKRPNTVWFSKSGDFYDFGTSSPLVSSDAVTVTIDSGQQNRIKWTCSSKQLVLGTHGDEWTVAGSGYEPLSFSSISASSHTNQGSEKVPAIRIGNVTLFIEKHGRRVNQFIYDFDSDSYDAIDLSALAPHLTEENSVLSWTYQQTPYGMLWCVREDGKLITLTFKREHKVTGWHVHDTDGKFLAVCSIAGNREDDLWAVVERTINGATKWYIEQKAPEFRSTDPEDCYFLDSYIVYEGVAVSTLTGLDHLEGKTVSILANGNVVSDKTVVGGEVQLDELVTTTKAVIGLKYESVVEPTLLTTDMVDGTSLGRVHRIAKVDVMLYKSLLFEYGKFVDDVFIAEELPFRMPADISDLQVPLYTGWKEFDFPEGYDPDIRMAIRQSRPLPLTLIAIADVVEFYD